MLGNRGQSLFLKLLLTLFLVVAAAFAAEAWLAIRAGRGAIEQLVGESLANRAEDTLRGVARHLADRRVEVSSWAALGVMDEILIRDRYLNIENLLLDLQRRHSLHYRVLTVLDRTQTVIASSDLSQVGRIASVESLAVRPVPGSELRMSDYPSRGGDPSSGLITFIHPIHSRLRTDPIGWLLAHVDWQPVEQIVSGSSPGANQPSAGQYILLLDRTNQVVAGDRQVLDLAPRSFAAGDRLLVGAQSSGSLREVGDFLLAEFSGRREDESPWDDLRVVALWRKNEAFAIFTIFTRAVLVAAALGLVLSAGAAFFNTRTIASRLRKLIEGTDRLARGEFSYRVEVGRPDELGRLARAFNAMAAELAQVRDGLEAAVARWKAIVTHAPDIIMTVDRRGEILFINRVISGLRVEDVVGRSVYEYIPPEHQDSLRAALEAVLSRGESVGLDHRAAAPGGTFAWYSSRIGPVVRDGEVVAATIITTDVTERKRLEQRILEATEAERERLGRDLHDGVGQILAGIGLHCRGLESRLQERHPAEADRAKQIKGLAAEAIQQTRVLARGLFPIELDRQGLKGALEVLAVGVEQMFHVRCQVEGDLGAPIRDRNRATHLFRIAQEAVSNAVRHGKASTVRINLACRDGFSQMSVEDDGVGFSAIPPDNEGMGLRSMRYRAEVLGAALEIRSSASGGTSVTCRFAS